MTGTLIVGGGPSGSALALRLARAGRAVTLVERAALPHDKVCGEFLSVEALGALAALGLDAASLGAVPITRVRLARRAAETVTALPFAAMSLSRRILDEALLGAAAAAGATVLRGRAVRTLQPLAGGWQARLDDGMALQATQAALATGKHELRGWRRPPGRQNDLVGFKQFFRLAPDQAAALAGDVALALFCGGYAGLQPVEQNRANLCLLVRRGRLAELGGDWQRLFEAILAAVPMLRRRLAGATPLLAQPLTVSGLPYGLVARPEPSGLWRLGDQAAVIPSFSGDGIAIALHTARRAGDAMLAGRDAAEYQASLAKELCRQVGRATLLSRMMVRPGAQRLLAGVCRVRPGLIGVAAKATRIQEGKGSARDPLGARHASLDPRPARPGR